jgi:magnesium transporter
VDRLGAQAETARSQSRVNGDSETAAAGRGRGRARAVVTSDDTPWMDSPLDDPNGPGRASSTGSAETELPADVAGGSNLTLVDAAGEVLTSPERADIEQRLRDGTYFWLDLHQPEGAHIELLGEVFGFHPLALEDSAMFDQRPKIDPYDDYAFLVVYGASGDADGLVEVHCFSAEQYLVTVRHDDCPAFVELQRRYMKRPDTLSDESMLVYHVVDGLVDSFFPSLSDMDERIDTLQAEIFSNPREEQLREIFSMKQRLVGVRRVIAPQRDMFAQLVGNVVTIPGISDETTRYFRDVYDHLIRLSEMIDSYRDLLTGVIDVYLSTVANRRDQIMKQLTVLAAIFLPITFITGFFGQNFGYMTSHLIGSPTAFVLGTALQIATVLAILGFFKRRAWI